MSCLTNTFLTSIDQSLNHSNGAASAVNDLSMERFISSLISDDTIEDNSKCGNCNNGSNAFSKCLNCNEFLCDTCVHVHQRVSFTQDHRISRFSATITPPLESPSPQVSALPDNICETHFESLKLFCQNCLVALCTECMVRDHCGHKIIYIEDIMETARQANKKLLHDARTTMLYLRSAMEQVQNMCESVEIRSLQTAGEVRNCIRRSIVALEERECELLRKIDSTRQVKGKLLLDQLETIRVALVKLTGTIELLSKCTEHTSAVDVIAINERASLEIRQVRALRSDPFPCEDDSIVFLPPDTGFLRALSNFGKISVSNPLMTSRNLVRSLPYRETRDGQIVLAPPRELRDSPDLRPKNHPVWKVGHLISVRETGPLPSNMFGSDGNEDGKFCRPWGVACDHNGNIVVVDRSNNRIQIFNSQGDFIHKFGSQGSGPCQFERPAGITINPQGHIVVADKDNHRIQILTMDGTFIHAFGERGSKNGQFNYPWDVACNYLGHILVSDTRNHRIQLFTKDGTFINKYGYEGLSTMWKHFDSPRGVCFTPRGNVVITDFNNHRLVVLDHNFNHVMYLGQEGSAPRQFLRPQGVICDDDGNIIVADSRNNRIQVFDSNGNYLWKVGVPGKAGGEMDRPSGLCLNPEGRVVVVDFGNARVQIF